jgi:transcriptional regulator of heat shock response
MQECQGGEQVLDDRKLAVLRAIVEDYVSTNEPVGSKSIVDRHNLDVSPATIRNDMAVLEEQGFIVQPHTSAGRVPTDKGYRLFVDRLPGVKPFSAAERRAIETFLAGAYDLDDVVMRTVRLLAQLTRQVAVVQYPSLTRSAVRHIELVPLTERRVLLILITDTGRVEQRSVDLPGPGRSTDRCSTRPDLRGRDHPAPRGAERLPRRAQADRGGIGGGRAPRADLAGGAGQRRSRVLGDPGEPGGAA